jgi:WS/DGAT/MGAT family acyltransferase
MADGLGGLAVLAALGDGAGGSAAAHPDAFPQPPPSAKALFADAWAERLAALARAPRTLAQSAAGLRELGLIGRRGSRPQHGPGPRDEKAPQREDGLRHMRAPRTSFNQPTGARRRITALAVPLEGVLGAAHAGGCTLNDVVLVAVSGALGSALRARGEEPGPFVVSVPISPRQGAEASRLGNANGVVPVVVPSDPDAAVRLARVKQQSEARKGAPRGTSAGPLGAAFRALARAGLFQRFIDHQRLVNTFLSNMRGPAEPISLAGHRITRIVPASITPGNVGVCFTVLSYAGELVLAVLADPDVVPEQDRLTDLLAGELARLTG